MPPDSGSFATSHYAGSDLPGALSRARELLGPPEGLPQLRPIALLAWHLLYDACRLAAAVPPLLEAAVSDPEISAESIEVIARKVLEHVIFLEYLHNNRHDETLAERFVATCRAEAKRAYERLGARERAEWPRSYEQMAQSQPELYQLYRRFSYLAHPKTCFPYSLLERDSGWSRTDFFSARSRLAVTDLAQILHIGTDNAWAIGVMPTNR